MIKMNRSEQNEINGGEWRIFVRDNNNEEFRIWEVSTSMHPNELKGWVKGAMRSGRRPAENIKLTYVYGQNEPDPHYDEQIMNAFLKIIRNTGVSCGFQMDPNMQ